MTLVIPESHLDLITRSIHGILTTMMPDGQPQSSLVWCDHDGECVRVHTSLERQKGKNMTANPKISLLIVDPQDTSRFISIRGEVEIVRENVVPELDAITRQYTSHPKYYGYVFPETKQSLETRIICRIHPSKIILDAIHK